MLATVLFITLLCSSTALSSVSRRATTNLDPAWAYNASQFYRRCSQASIVIGDYLYIDGGEIYYLDDQKSPRSLPLNSTYSVSLTSTWTNRSISLNPIAKGSAPVLNGANVWPDDAGTSFYSFNGIVSQAYTTPPEPPPDQLWQFLPDGSSGSWTIVDAPNLKRLNKAGSTSGNGSSYILGGWGSWLTDSEYSSNTALRHPGGGLVTYNLDTRTWANQSIAELAPSGWSYEAEFHYLEGLQRDGLLLAMGGATAPPGPISSGGQTLNSYGYVSLFDTATGTWYNQSTTGDIPVQRYDTCSVGVQGDNGTFEIFLYGGSVVPPQTTQPTDQQSNIDLAKVSILSLPSFHWHTTALNPKHSRAKHSCNLAGNRQMIVVGGAIANVANAHQTKDPWAQGLGVFDMTELEWKDSYDPSAATYQTPNIVKQYISANGQYPTTWDSQTVESWLSAKAAPNPTSSSSPASSSPASNGGSGSSNTGAIVGGVVGGVGGLLILGSAFFYRRHQRSRRIGRQSLNSEELITRDQEQPHGDASSMVDMTSHPEELAATEPRTELPGMPVGFATPAAKEAAHGAHELP
ncbi:uncharacterized protein PV07_04034 [Cladophialophora immunda]|uniref:Kelch repeat protein n=1 Tax=Cladophialophora immunda TaxID=569365 RepID=A0A0D1ZWF5_9EURO|nr:uncharacterized protein PV07_04034 [Cladophialophora immunda]KIW32491.1 hypothetical protein PV07_04034 [Cladophialophora immunda]